MIKIDISREWLELFGQAKEMEKQQIGYSEKQMDDAYDKGFKDALEKMYNEEEVIRIAKLSYNKARIATGNSEVSFNIWFDTWFELFKKK